jgi:hypothetical protein
LPDSPAVNSTIGPLDCSSAVTLESNWRTGPRLQRTDAAGDAAAMPHWPS